MIRHLGKFAASGLLLAAALFLPTQACADAKAALEAQPPTQETEAEAVLAAALAEAEDTDRLIFVHSGAPW